MGGIQNTSGPWFSHLSVEVGITKLTSQESRGDPAVVGVEGMAVNEIYQSRPGLQARVLSSLQWRAGGCFLLFDNITTALVLQAKLW
jgi:hypothetical protein